LKGVIQWFLQRLTGLILLIGLIVHFYIMHYSGTGALDYETVTARLSSPYWKGFDILFLLSILYHGFNGLWGIATEYIKESVVLRILQTVIVAASIGLFITGIRIVV